MLSIKGNYGVMAGADGGPRRPRAPGSLLRRIQSEDGSRIDGSGRALLSGGRSPAGDSSRRQLAGGLAQHQARLGQGRRGRLSGQQLQQAHSGQAAQFMRGLVDRG